MKFYPDLQDMDCGECGSPVVTRGGKMGEVLVKCRHRNCANYGKSFAVTIPPLEGVEVREEEE